MDIVASNKYISTQCDLTCNICRHVESRWPISRQCSSQISYICMHIAVCSYSRDASHYKPYAQFLYLIFDAMHCHYTKQTCILMADINCKLVNRQLFVGRYRADIDLFLYPWHNGNDIHCSVFGITISMKCYHIVCLFQFMFKKTRFIIACYRPDDVHVICFMFD